MGEHLEDVATRGEAPLNVKATLPPKGLAPKGLAPDDLAPDDLARACAEAMWKDDDASKGLGMEIVEIKSGQAMLAMTVQPYMVNGQRIAHGGFIFTLADSAFAFACNTHNERAVAAQGSITFIRPGKLGDMLVATAREISRSGRSGIYDVRVTAKDVVIAEFRGHSRSIGGTWLPEQGGTT
jgi:acyl-CoA thioesterase